MKKADSDYLMRGLLHAFYWVDEGLQRHLQAAGWEPVSRTQSMIMVNVSDGITRPSEMARRLGISRQAVQQLLADMERRGLVRLLPDPSDARAKIVRFSRRGADIGRAALEALARIDREVEKRLGRETYLHVRKALLERDWGEVVEPGGSVRGAARRPMPRRARGGRAR